MKTAVYLLINSFLAFPLEQPLSFLSIGDWGEPSNLDQGRKTAKGMNSIANGISFVVAVGDNFYSDGVKDAYDPKWKSVFSDVFGGLIGSVPWYAVMGNHDWYGNHRAEIDYGKVNSHWVMEDYFYDRVYTTFGKKVAIIFIDTDLMHYGYGGTGDSNYPGNMLVKNFQKQGWTPDQNTLESQFVWVKQKLDQYKDYDYVVVAGHHDVVTCANKSTGMIRLQKLMEDYRVSMYIFGHRHSLGFAQSGSTMYVQNGAGGQIESACSEGNSSWGIGMQYGFTKIQIDSSALKVGYYTADGKFLHKESTRPRR